MQCAPFPCSVPYFLPRDCTNLYPSLPSRPFPNAAPCTTTILSSFSVGTSFHGLPVRPVAQKIAPPPHESSQSVPLTLSPLFLSLACFKRLMTQFHSQLLESFFKFHFYSLSGQLSLSSSLTLAHRLIFFSSFH